MTSPRLLDTNILLRYLTGDDPAKARRSLTLLTRVDGGNDMSEPPSPDGRGPRRCQATGDVMGATLAIWWSALGLMLLLVAAPGPSGAGAALAQGTQPPATATPAGNIDGQQAEQIARQAMDRAVGPEAIVPARVEVYPAPGGWIVIFHDAQARCIDRSWWPGACRGVSPQDVIGELYACVDPAGRVYGFGSNIRPISAAEAATCGIVPPPGTPDPARGVGPSGSSVAPPPGGFSVRRPTQTASASAEVPVVPEAGTGWLVGIGLLTLCGVAAWRRCLRPRTAVPPPPSSV